MANEPQQQPQQPQEPVAPATPYEQQPVAQQYFAQPQAAPVQYVVAAKSLKGKGGWLGFFMVIAGIAALGYISAFFQALQMGTITAIIFMPLLFIGALASTILIALEMKIAKWTYIGFLAVTTLYSIVSAIVAGGDITTVASSIIASIVVLVLVSLYFIVSKRVKETLIK